MLKKTNNIKVSINNIIKESFSTDEKRIKWVDIFKGILIILVILSHQHEIPDIYLTFFTPFFLTGFFFASGYLYKDKSIKDFLKKRVFNLLIPWLLLSVLELLLNKGVMISIFQDISNLKNQMFRILTGNSLWFFPCLFVVEFYFLILKKTVKNEKLLYPIVLLISIIGLWIMTPGTKRFFHFDVALFMLLFYMLGYSMKENEQKIKKTVLASNIILFILAIIYLLIRLYDFIFLKSYINLVNSELGNIPVYIISAIIGIYIVYILSNKIKKNVFLSFLGENTLLYYSLHFKTFVIVDKFLLKLNISNFIYCFINATITIIILIIPIILINKYIPILSGRYKPKIKNNHKNFVK